MRWFRRERGPEWPTRDESGSSWFLQRLTYWRQRYATFWAAQPTVEQRQQLEDERLRLAARQSAEEIARHLAWQNVWMGPGDAEAGPPGLIGFAEWSSSTALGDERRGE